MQTFLANPESKKEQNLNIVQEIGEQVKGFQDLLNKFFKVLSDASRLELLAVMSKPFEEILLEKIIQLKQL